MTKREQYRAQVLIRVAEKRLSQVEAAKVLEVSLRHIKRLYKAFLAEGVAALISKKRGKPSNHQLPKILKGRIKELVTCELYKGFGPTFMCEKLEELHGIKISRETARLLMVEAGVWKAKQQKRPVVHQQRPRRTRRGELIQIDGSPHAWFEDRGEPCVLIVFIDDATGQTYGKFFESETTENYLIVLLGYILKYGIPLSMYSDKHSIFRVNTPGLTKRESITQFGRVLQELGIELICANSPQAKGRVERVNGTLQDRLVKELRLAGVRNMEEANRFLETYWDVHNAKFAIKPENKLDAHRKVPTGLNLNRILSKKHTRKVTKNLEVQYKNTIYQINPKSASTSLRRASITIIECLDGTLVMEYKGHPLSFKEYSKQECVGQIVDSKEIDRFLKKAATRKVPDTHPWKRGSEASNKMQQDFSMQQKPIKTG